MPYRPHIIDLLGTGLAECPKYHDGLDSFLIRAGVSKARVDAARAEADERDKASRIKYQRAPKRLVARAILADLARGTPDDDRVVAALITGLCKGTWLDPTNDGLTAVEDLKVEQVVERQEVQRQRAERQLQ